MGPFILRTSKINDRRRAPARIFEIRRDRVRNGRQRSQHKRIKGFRLR